MKIAAKQKDTTFEEIEKQAIKTMPLGRYQRPEELGNSVAFLYSELA